MVSLIVHPLPSLSKNHRPHAGRQHREAELNRDRHPSRRILRGRGPEFQGAAWRYCESSCRPSASEVVAETELPAAGRSCRFRRGRAGICFSIPPHRHGRVGREPRAAERRTDREFARGPSVQKSPARRSRSSAQLGQRISASLHRPKPPSKRNCCAQRLGAAAMVQTERMADLGENTARLYGMDIPAQTAKCNGRGPTVIPRHSALAASGAMPITSCRCGAANRRNSPWPRPREEPAPVSR
jgi:hypothetical protein